MIGHEIGHGFDDQGSQVRRRRQPERLVDATDDRTEFEQRDQASWSRSTTRSSRADAGQHVNGELTLGENIGDLGGLTIALPRLPALAGRQPSRR